MIPLPRLVNTFVFTVVMPDAPRPVATTRVVSYAGALQQALRDVAAWVELGIAPPPSTEFEVHDCQVVVPPAASARRGIQPVATVTANGGERADVAVGEPVRFEAVVEVPPGAGTLHATRALYELIQVQQDGRRDLLDVVEEHRPHLPPGSTAALLSGTIFLDLGRLDETLAALASRGVRPVVLLVNKDSFLPIDRRAAPREEAAAQIRAARWTSRPT